MILLQTTETQLNMVFIVKGIHVLVNEAVGLNSQLFLLSIFCLADSFLC